MKSWGGMFILLITGTRIIALAEKYIARQIRCGRWVGSGGRSEKGTSSFVCVACLVLSSNDRNRPMYKGTFYSHNLEILIRKHLRPRTRYLFDQVRNTH
jgi:hypothetical protein